jgi:hypothetical protein
MENRRGSSKILHVHWFADPHLPWRFSCSLLSRHSNCTGSNSSVWLTSSRSCNFHGQVVHRGGGKSSLVGRSTKKKSLYFVKSQPQFTRINEGFERSSIQLDAIVSSGLLGATVAHLTPDQKAVGSNPAGIILTYAY